MVWYSHLLMNFPQFVVIHTVRDFGVVNKADIFLELSCFLDDPMDVGNLISGSSAFSKTSLNIWKNVVHWRREWQTTSVSCLENLINSMKRQKDRTLKDELPRSVGAQYATEDHVQTAAQLHTPHTLAK